MKYFILFCVFISHLQLSAQAYLTKQTAKGKALKWYESAKANAYNKDYDKSTKELKKLLVTYPNFIDAHLLLAQIHFDKKEYDKSAAAFNKVLEIDNAYNPKVYYMFGMNEWHRNEFMQAANYLEQYIQTKPRSTERLKRAQRFATNARFAADAIRHPTPFAPRPMSNAINSERSEYAPAFTADENMLIFTRRVRAENTPRPYVHEDFYVSRRNEQGNWEKAVPMTGINTLRNEGGHSISADGKLLVFTACDYKGGQGGCDIFYVRFQNKRWSSPKSVGTAINTRASETLPTLSADGKTMIFASDRGGTKGKKDLWISHQKSNGTWGTPQNIGEKLNTPYDENAPFLHPDGETLYFMSDGHPGMGGDDLYYSKRQADGSWGTPINLGYPINTKEDEGAFALSFDGGTAYFARDKTESTNANLLERDIDIFTFEMPESARPKAVTYVRATVRDAANQQLLADVQVSFTELATATIHSEVHTDKTGTFLTVLPSRANYALSVNKAGYVFYSEHFALKDGIPDTPFQLEIALLPIAETTNTIVKETPIVLKNVFFDTGSANLLASSQSELNRLKNLLEQHPKLEIQINGHTDNIGDEQANLILSEARAKAVYEYLIQAGIVASRLRYKGYGESAPIADNATKDGQRKNRRTEFVLTR